MRPRSLLYPVGLLALAAIYFAAARLSLRLGMVEQVTAVWPPTGIALAAVLLSGNRLWPAISAGALLANLLAHEPVATACGIALGNTLEALVGAWLLRGLMGFRCSLDRLRDALSLVLFAALLSTMVSATIGVTSLCLGGVHPWAAFGRLWGVWWVGDAVGNLIVAPVLLTWAGVRPSISLARRAFEVLALATALVLTCLCVFCGIFPTPVGNYPLEFTIFPLLIWTALRFGPPVSALATLAISGMALWGTLHDVGPFAHGRGYDSLVVLQSFIGVLAVTGLVLTAAVTERRLIGEDLQRSHDLLSAITEGTTDAVFVKDLQGRYLMINSAGAGFLGKPVNEILTNDDRRFFSPETAVAIMERDRRVMVSGKTQTYEDVGTAAGVTRTYLSTKGPYHDRRGEVVGLVGISRDITERKQLERELERRVAELAEAERRKDEFLAMLAHELRNPLAPIHLAVQVTRRAELNDAQFRSARDVIDRQVHHMVRLVDDLLDVSRITRGKIELRKEPLDLAPVISHALETSRPLIDSKNHELQVALPQVPVHVLADPARLAQVLANLLNNAAKYTGAGGRIWLTVERDGATVLIKVRDSGRGIPPTMLPKVFELFAQVDVTLDRAEGGLGIGLTLVKTLVEMHGGSVHAESAGPGCGSEFIVRLPVLDHPIDPARSSDTSNVSSSPPARRRILIVEDNADTAESLALFLQLMGQEVCTAPDGPTALATARQFCPEIVLLDIGLPRMDGYEVARRLRQEASTAETILVALTGYGQQEDRRRALDAGFDHHLTKPADPAAVQALLTSSKSRV